MIGYRTGWKGAQSLGDHITMCDNQEGGLLSQISESSFTFGSVLALSSSTTTENTVLLFADHTITLVSQNLPRIFCFPP